MILRVLKNRDRHQDYLDPVPDFQLSPLLCVPLRPLRLILSERSF